MQANTQFHAQSRSKGDWHRKSICALSDALGHQLQQTCPTRQDQHLTQVRDALKAASRMPFVEERQFLELRGALCEVCREHGLCACDVPTGWSPHCALMQKAL